MGGTLVDKGCVMTLRANLISFGVLIDRIPGLQTEILNAAERLLRVRSTHGLHDCDFFIVDRWVVTAGHCEFSAGDFLRCNSEFMNSNCFEGDFVDVHRHNIFEPFEEGAPHAQQQRHVIQRERERA